jgi:biopolymer transport protein ExbD
MAKFKKKAKTKQDIPTSALPDIIFMLLFFFMVTTVLRETTVLVQNRVPAATELRKLQKKSLVSYIYIGEPKNTEQWGSEPRIQADDSFIDPSGVGLWVTRKKDNLNENDREQLTVALKVDEEAKRGLVSDVEMELRKSNSRKVLYTTIQRMDK